VLRCFRASVIWRCGCSVDRWAEARVKIARMTLTIKLDGNWSSFQLANNTPASLIVSLPLPQGCLHNRATPSTDAVRVCGSISNVAEFSMQGVMGMDCQATAQGRGINTWKTGGWQASFCKAAPRQVWVAVAELHCHAGETTAANTIDIKSSSNRPQQLKQQRQLQQQHAPTEAVNTTTAAASRNNGININNANNKPQ